MIVHIQIFKNILIYFLCLSLFSNKHKLHSNNEEKLLSTRRSQEI